MAVLASASPAPAQGPQQKSREVVGEPVRPPTRTPQAVIFFCAVRDVNCRTDENRFYLNEVRDLFVFVSWGHLRGEHVARVRFLLPDGNVYQQSELKFTTEQGERTNHPRKSDENVQVAVISRGEPATVLDFPVAGTHISQRSLTGTWIVEVELDSKPVARRNLFLLPNRTQ